MKTMMKAVQADIDAGKIEELFILAQQPDGELVTYAMGQSASEMVFDMERAKVHFIVGAADYTSYEDEDES